MRNETKEFSANFIRHLPVAPVNLVLMSSLLLVRLVSHEAHAYNLVPLMCSRKIRPILQSPS